MEVASSGYIPTPRSGQGKYPLLATDTEVYLVYTKTVRYIIEHKKEDF